MGDTARNDTIPKFDQLAREVAEVVLEITGVQIVDFDINLATHGIDSLYLLDALAVLETKFGVLFADSVIEEFYSINRTARIVQDALRARGKKTHSS